MDYLHQILHSLSGWTQSYLSEIALTLLATLMVVYGDVLNKYIKKIIRPYPFVIRTIVFVLVCAFGYGFLIVFLSPHVQTLLMHIPFSYRGLSIVIIFCILGVLAENRRYI